MGLGQEAFRLLSAIKCIHVPFAPSPQVHGYICVCAESEESGQLKLFYQIVLFLQHTFYV